MSLGQAEPRPFEDVRKVIIILQIAPDRPSVAGTPADKRFGNGASDTSKINFNGVHQTGSTPDYRLRKPFVGVPATPGLD
jgi:hypothetical protein